MRLTAEFKAAKDKVVRQETAMNPILDQTLNKKARNIGDISDIYFERHLQKIADLYMSIYGKTEYLFEVPITHASKTYLTLHADDLKKVLPELIEIIHSLEDEKDKKLIDPEHQITIAKIVIGFSKLVDNHEKLVVDFANIAKASKNNKSGNSPSP